MVALHLTEAEASALERVVGNTADYDDVMRTVFDDDARGKAAATRAIEKLRRGIAAQLDTTAQTTTERRK
jgi:hypothetical protein